MQTYLSMCFSGYSLQFKHDILVRKGIILQLELNLVRSLGVLAGHPAHTLPLRLQHLLLRLRGRRRRRHERAQLPALWLSAAGLLREMPWLCCS